LPLDLPTQFEITETADIRAGCKMNNKIRNTVLTMIAALVGLPGPPPLAASEPVGFVELLPACPGDVFKKRTDVSVQAQESLLASILSPLIGQTVSVGLDRLGSRLKEASEEKKVATLQTGTYLYKLQGDGSTLNPRCLIVVSRSVEEDKKQGLAAMSRDYLYATTTITEDTGDRAIVYHKDFQCRAGSEGCQTIVDYLKAAGFSDRVKPGVLGVFELELSNERTEFRLVPRFVVTDHSLRDERRDSKRRDLTFEIALHLPGTEEPAAELLFKFERLRHSQAFVIETDDAMRPDPVMTSRWIPLPEPSSRVSAKLAKRAELNARVKASVETAVLAAATIRNHTSNNPPEFQSMQFPCKSNVDTYFASYVDAKAELAALQTRATKSNPLSKEIAAATSRAAYYSACNDRSTARAAMQAELDKGFEDGYLSRAANISVDIKEFRKRPVIEFLADVLADDDTRSSVAEAITNSIDPAAIEKAAQEAAAEQVANLEKYEEARIADENAMLNYVAAADDQKATLFITMDSAKRSANRKARTAGVSIPYPESGFWY